MQNFIDEYLVEELFLAIDVRRANFVTVKRYVRGAAVGEEYDIFDRLLTEF